MLHKKCNTSLKENMEKELENDHEFKVCSSQMINFIQELDRIRRNISNNEFFEAGCLLGTLQKVMDAVYLDLIEQEEKDLRKKEATT